MKIIIKTYYDGEEQQETLTDNAKRFEDLGNGQAQVVFTDTDGHDKVQIIALDGDTEIIAS